MLPFQRRLAGNRIYWRDADIDRIAKQFDATNKEIAELPLLRERDAGAIEATFQAAAPDTSKGSGLRDGEEFRFILSSASVDSYGDTINQLGWDYGRVDSNFPVLAFHEGKSAIGQWTGRVLHDGKLKATFKEASSSAYAQFVVSQLRERTLRASSVGFIPGDWEWSSDPKRKWGIDFKQGHVLLEASIVSIPANPDALLEMHIPGQDKEIGSPEAQPAPSGAKSLSVKLARARADALKAHF